ncbi:MAG: FAD-dependent oxidoreductase, partial [Oscillibacter sp.]
LGASTTAQAIKVAVRNGVELKLGCKVTGLTEQGDSLLIQTSAGAYETRYLVNCAGVHGQEICAMAGPAEWESQPARGEYYLLDKSSGDLVQHVIFQCPTAAGKGVLLAPTVHGNLIVGPNTEPAENGDDCKTTQIGLDFVAEASRKSVPSVNFRETIRNFSGVRAVTSEPDFIIRPSRSCRRLLHIAGIKSPGLTAAPAIAEYAAGLLETMGVSLRKKDHWDGTRTQIRFQELSPAEQAVLVRKDPRYGRVICRCETITEGEIVAAIRSPIPPCSIDGVKRRAGSGMGRCQGGFCGPRVMELLSRELGCSPLEILQDGGGTFILSGATKGGLGT